MKHVHSFTEDVLADLDAVGVAAAIAAGDFSATEAVDAALARIDTVNPQLNAVAVDDRERARKRAADEAYAPGVFAGVPSIIKNNTLFAGLPTRHGSAAVPERAAAASEPFTEQLLATGVNLVGASTLPAFGLTATTEFVDRDPTRNPWDTDFSCGASSGGSAALVAAGALPIAHANDGGGSIRIPAAACGLVGLKPTRNRVAPSPEGESMPIDLISNGVLTRSVRDTAYFLADAERFRPAPDLPPVGLVEGPSERRLRIAMLTEPLTGQLLDPDTQRGLTEAAELLESLGHRTEFVPIPVERDYVDQFTAYWAMLAFALDRFGKRMIDKDFDRSQLDPFTRGLSRRFLRSFWRTPSVLRGLKKSTAQLRETFTQFDAVLSPTLAHTTPEIGYLDPGGDFDEIFSRLTRYVAFTPANNTSGTPAISLPLARTSTGLPLGIHFSADLGDERTLLELAYELEAAAPFARIQDAV
ncbi:amidase [Gordonia sp. NB41Y]|uniref:amidase n=1 Tax=Gordonia sp. NB41Y TaxID=875808 RepID=UPI0006B14503|nr:amidase [Gordonia sp. NB41Y]KOY49662.1 amidase [Gordonia sp. NB41Y]WLP92340.1 amidase [Gordonia sp. NB41Y]